MAITSLRNIKILVWILLLSASSVGCSQLGEYEVDRLRKLGVKFMGYDKPSSELVALERKSTQWISDHADQIIVVLCDDFFDNTAMHYITRFRNLEELHLMQSKVSDIGLMNLKHLPNMKSMSLYRSRITDKGVRYIASSRNLKWLNIAETNVTDDSIDHLKKLDYLEFMDVSGTKITKSGIIALKRNLPMLDVYHGSLNK